MSDKSNLPKVPFNINSPLSKPDKARIQGRKSNKFYGRCPRDGSSVSREMAQAARFNMYRRLREEKDDPYTKHALSFEEFDNIPDIVDLIKEKK